MEPRRHGRAVPHSRQRRRRHANGAHAKRDRRTVAVWGAWGHFSGAQTAECVAASSGFGLTSRTRASQNLAGLAKLGGSVDTHMPRLLKPRAYVSAKAMDAHQVRRPSNAARLFISIPLFVTFRSGAAHMRLRCPRLDCLWIVKICRLRKMFAQLWPMLARFGSTLANIGPKLRNLRRT